MGGAISNVRAGTRPRSALVVLPALACVFALGGVTARPALDMRAAHDAHRVAEERLERFREQSALDRRYIADGRIEELRAGLARVRALLPPRSSAVDVHAMVRLAAARAGFVLTTLSVGDQSELGLECDRDRIVQREVCLGGRASAGAIPAFVARLRSLGQPCAVLEATLTRESARDVAFDVHMCLGLFETAPLPPSFPQTGELLAGSAPAASAPTESPVR